MTTNQLKSRARQQGNTFLDKLGNSRGFSRLFTTLGKINRQSRNQVPLLLRKLVEKKKRKIEPTMHEISLSLRVVLDKLIRRVEVDSKNDINITFKTNSFVEIYIIEIKKSFLLFRIIHAHLQINIY